MKCKVREMQDDNNVIDHEGERKIEDTKDAKL